MAVIVKRVNRLGIPAIKTINASLSDTRLTLTFANHANVSDFFQGLFLVYVTSLPTLPAPENAVPIYLNTEGYLGSDKQLFTPQGVAVTTSVIAEGVYLCFYDSTTDKVRVMM